MAGALKGRRLTRLLVLAAVLTFGVVQYFMGHERYDDYASGQWQICQGGMTNETLFRPSATLLGEDRTTFCRCMREGTFMSNKVRGPITFAPIVGVRTDYEQDLFGRDLWNRAAESCMARV